MAQQLDPRVRDGRPERVDEVSNKAMTEREDDTPQIRAREILARAAELARFHADNLRNFYVVAPHIVATLARSADDFRPHPVRPVSFAAIVQRLCEKSDERSATTGPLRAQVQSL